MSAGMQVPDLNSWLNEFVNAFGGAEITKETIDALAMSLAVYQTQNAMQQVEVSMQRAGVDMQQIELEKARLQFEMEDMMPFKREQMGMQREQMLLENEFSREKMENDRLMMADRTTQSKHQTMQAAIGESSARAQQAMAYNQLAANHPSNKNSMPYYHSSPYRVDEDGSMIQGGGGQGQPQVDPLQAAMMQRNRPGAAFGQFG